MSGALSSVCETDGFRLFADDAGDKPPQRQLKNVNSVDSFEAGPHGFSLEEKAYKQTVKVES